MLLHRTLAAIFLFLVSAVWANSFTQVIAATYALAKIIAKDDQDVKEITLLTPLAAKSIPDDIAHLTVAFNNARLNNAGAKASDVNSTEEQLVDADSTLTSNLLNYTYDLELKKTILETLGQKGVIFTNLLNLTDAAGAFQIFLQGLVEDPNLLTELTVFEYQIGLSTTGASRIFSQ